MHPSILQVLSRVGSMVGSAGSTADSDPGQILADPVGSRVGSGLGSRQSGRFRVQPDPARIRPVDRSTIEVNRSK